MKLCDKCFSLLDENDLYCKECGAAVAEGVEGSDSIVYPEIARANLARLRGELEEAERICRSILKQYPNNVSAHILLGDLCFDANQLEEARQWYDLAIGLAPENVMLSKKLARATELLEAQREKDATEELAVSESKSHIWASVGVVVAILAFGALAFWYGKMRAETSYKASLVNTDPIDFNGIAPPRAAEPPVNPNPPQAEDGSKQPENAETAPSTQSGTSVVRSEGMTPQEKALLDAVRSALGGSGAACEAVFRMGSSCLLIALRQPDWTEEDNNAFVHLAAKALFEQDAGLTTVEVRFADSGSGEVTQSSTVSRDQLASSPG
jgi:hypothetical protein